VASNSETSTGTISSTVYGYPRIGDMRQLKRATESYWGGKSSAEELMAVGAAMRADAWSSMRAAGIEEIPSNTFSFYDHMLDMVQLLDAIPARHRHLTGSQIDRYFAMARGNDEVSPLEMTKWFDTNYHYLVPELGPDTDFRIADEKPFEEFAEAQLQGINTRPVLIGPITFLALSKPANDAPANFDPLSLLQNLLPVYGEIISRLGEQGAEWVQLDEPILVKDQPQSVFEATSIAYDYLTAIEHRPKILVATYFGPLDSALPLLANTPVDGIGIDLTERGGDNLAELIKTPGIEDKRVVAGVVDGRNIWANPMDESLETLASILGKTRGLVVGSSCSLLHVPYDVNAENNLDAEVKGWLSFAVQKLDEVANLTTGLRKGTEAISDALDTNRKAFESRRNSRHTTNAEVRSRVQSITLDHHQRATGIGERARLQRERFGLPDFPTTTIGSFPQTAELRKARRDLGKGVIDQAEYETRIKAEIQHVVSMQEDLGIDVLVHGEPERNDMVQYFAEQLNGFFATENGWVQSYGTRYVRPPIIAGDVTRPAPMTVEWSKYAQSLTQSPMKGMLTGPVTMLCWSFVRNDQPWAVTARQVALALRDEVNDLEATGITVIQVDEPALREGLPLRSAQQTDYLDWATEAFRLTTSGVVDTTQIHTHMCYAEFGEILDSVAALDADVISLEATRSRMAITTELAEAKYPGAVGPGVYDIHSPRVPTTEEMTELLQQAAKAIPVQQLWVNPDCGLKTRGETEVRQALANMVAAAKAVRS
jgi:5-methyltetrahydropteroyltriglutamate--homocysteine methyltransferase